MAEETVKLEVDGEIFTFTKDTLINKSDYFKAMFSSNMKEASADVVCLQDTDLEAFSILVQFMQTSVLGITADNICKVTETASMYQITEGMDKCCDFIKDILSMENCLELLQFSDTHGLQRIYNLCRRLVLWNFNTIKSTSAFGQVQKSCVIDIITDPQLNVACEAEVLDAVELWHEFEPSTREDDMEEILLHSGYCDYLTLKDLREMAERKLLRNCKDVLARIRTALEAKKRQTKERHIPYLLLLHCSRLRDTSARFWQVDETKGKVLQYDKILTNPEACSASAALRKIGQSLCVHDGKIFLCGGVTDFYKQTWSSSNDLWCYDLILGKWKVLTQLLHHRRHHGMVGLGSKIFLLGGFGQYRVKLNSVESFDYHTGKWQTCAPMPAFTFSMNTVTRKGKIYIYSSQFVGCYDPDTDLWQEFTDVSDYYRQIGLGNHGDSNQGNNDWCQKWEKCARSGDQQSSAILCNGVHYFLSVERDEEPSLSFYNSETQKSGEVTLDFEFDDGFVNLLSVPCFKDCR